MTPALFAHIQCLNQFLNQRSELRGITLVRHRQTKFALVLLHAVSHVNLRFRCECCGEDEACLVPRR